jgi:hypothetical protein
MLAQAARRFTLRHSEDFEIGLSLSLEFYVSYMLTETNVEAAVAAGTNIDDIRAWCTRTLATVFEGRAREVIFRGYVAHLEPAA